MGDNSFEDVTHRSQRLETSIAKGRASSTVATDLVSVGCCAHPRDGHVKLLEIGCAACHLGVWHIANSLLADFARFAVVVNARPLLSMRLKLPKLIEPRSCWVGKFEQTICEEFTSTSIQCVSE